MKRYLSLFLFLGMPAFAVTQTEVNQNISGLMVKIDQVNQDLQKKQKQQKSLDSAISDSEQAIGASQQLLSQLKEKRSLDVQQLKELNTVLPEMESATQQAQSHVRSAISSIYQEIRTIQTTSQSVIAGNDTLDSKRKQTYLVELLKAEQVKYQSLQVKLDQLKVLNDKLALEVDRLNTQLGVTTKTQQQLLLEKQSKLDQEQALHDEINETQKQLSDLKQKQSELNKLLHTLQQTAYKQPKKTSTIKTTVNTNNEMSAPEDDSPFFNRKLAKPLNAKVAIPYGAMRHGVRNNGVLYNATNTVVYSISDGVVMYVGDLPGFGTVLVINHGDNYMSIYGGVIPSIRKGQNVTTGQVIANAGTKTNQPMGGVYFELRHLGRPVNPLELAN